MTVIASELVYKECPCCEIPITRNTVIGIEVRGYYDGVVMWECRKCKWRWKRFYWVEDKLLRNDPLVKEVIEARKAK